MHESHIDEKISDASVKAQSWQFAGQLLPKTPRGALLVGCCRA